MSDRILSGNPDLLDVVDAAHRDAHWRTLEERDRPTVFRNAVASCAARDQWSLGYLAGRVGDREIPIEYSLHPIYRPRPDLNEGRYWRKLVSFRQAAELIADQPNRSTWHYISSLPVESYLPELLEDLPATDVFARRKPRRRALFLGNGGSGSWMHYDTTENVMVLFSGAKRILLVPAGIVNPLRPYATRWSCCKFSSLAQNRDGNGEGMFKMPPAIPYVECRIEAGEAIYLPSGWWHYIVNENLSIGVSYIWSATLKHRFSRQFLRVNVTHRAHLWMSELGEKLLPKGRSR